MPIKNCCKCGKEFRGRQEVKSCQPCLNAWRATPKTGIMKCLHCKNDFEYYLHRGDVKYCSMKCHARVRIVRVTLNCARCGQNFQAKPRKAQDTERQTENKYCSVSCRNGTTVDAQGNRVCLCCKTSKHIFDFAKGYNTKDGFAAVCKACKTKRNRANSIKKLYKLSLRDYEAMKIAQNGKCAICLKAPKKLFIDHCHNSGKVRGLLCHFCNVGLGNFRDNPKFLAAAMGYLASSILANSSNSDEVNS